MSAVAGRATVLLYMVDAGEREALQSRLEASDVDVHAISKLADAGELISQCTRPICFVEVKTGDAVGLDVIRELSASEAARAIVVLSSNRDMESRMAGRDAGASDYLRARASSRARAGSRARASSRARARTTGTALCGRQR